MSDKRTFKKVYDTFQKNNNNNDNKTDINQCLTKNTYVPPKAINDYMIY